MADALAARYQGKPSWTRLIASPRRRALDTAQALAAPRKLQVEVNPLWAEVDFGDWDGQHGSNIDPVALAAFHRDPVRDPPPGGEPWPAFESRIGKALIAVINDHQPEPGSPAPLLIVSHAGVLRMAMSLVCGFPLASLWAVRIDYGTRLRLRMETTDDGQLWGELLEIQQQ